MTTTAFSITAISLLLVGLACNSSYTVYVFAAPRSPNFDSSTDCANDPEVLAVSCCWTESDEEGIEIKYCQICDIDLATGDYVTCGQVHQAFTAPPTSGDSVFPRDGVLEQPPNPPPKNDANVPSDGGVLEQPNTPQRTPGGGVNVPLEGGVLDQPSTDQSLAGPAR